MDTFSNMRHIHNDQPPEWIDNYESLGIGATILGYFGLLFSGTVLLILLFLGMRPDGLVLSSGDWGATPLRFFGSRWAILAALCFLFASLAMLTDRFRIATTLGLVGLTVTLMIYLF